MNYLNYDAVAPPTGQVAYGKKMFSPGLNSSAVWHAFKEKPARRFFSLAPPEDSVSPQ